MTLISNPPSSRSIFQFPPNFPNGQVSEVWLAWFQEVQANNFVFPPPVTGFALGWDANGNLVNVPNTGADQTAAWTAADAALKLTIESNLASASDAAKGAGSVGFDYATAYTGSTVGKWLKDLATGTGATFLGYLAPLTGAVVKTIADVFGDFPVSPDWFGAAGNGVTDDASPIQLALNTGLSVRLGDKPYRIASGVTYTADYQRFFGSGPNSKLLCTTGSTNNGVNMVTALSKTGVVFEGIRVENSGYGLTIPAAGVYTGMGYGVAFINCHAGKVLNSYFKKCGSSGQGVAAIYFSSSTECLAQGNHVTLSQNGINSDSWYYANDNSTRSRNNCITGNVLYNNEGSPVVCDISDSLAGEVGDTITANVCYSNKYGISVSGAKATVANNLINMNNYSNGGVGWDAIWVTGVALVISGNIIVNPYKAGICLQAKVTGYPVGGAEMRDTVVSDNVIIWDSGIAAGGSDSHGIRVVNNSAANAVEGIILANNKIIRARTNGILLDGSAFSIYDVSIRGNQIENAGAEGILANNIYSGGLSVEGNAVKNCTNEGIKLTTAPRAIVANNRVISNGKAGIYLSASPRSNVSGNQCWDNGTSAANTYDGIYVTGVSGISSIYGNHLGNISTANTRYGLNVDDATSAGYQIFGNSYGSNATGTKLVATSGSYTGSLEGELGQREIWANAAPVAGAWSRGDRVWSIVPSASGTIGWVCVTSGSPGTWKTFGVISA